MKTFTCFLTLFSMAAAFAQDVPPPPKPDTTDPALAPLLESLKQTLLSSGRVDYSLPDGKGGKNLFWRQITSVAVDAPGCQARVHFDQASNGSEARDGATSLFFESVGAAEAFSQAELWARRGQPRANYSESVHLLSINGDAGMFVFSSQAQAGKAAEAVTRAARICRAVPVALNTSAGGPGLPETLQFIAEKLNDNGAVNLKLINQNPDGSPAGTPISQSVRLTEASADLSTCRVHFTRKVTTAGNDVITPIDISFRRVEKLEVATEQDAANAARARSGQTQILKTEPVVYRLSVRYLSGNLILLTFRDEEIANRIAKAMNHAVELCGGGSKDPF